MKKFKVTKSILISSMLLLGPISVADTTAQVEDFNQQVMGNGSDSFEAYEKVMRSKCAGPTLMTCSSTNSDLEAIHLCMPKH